MLTTNQKGAIAEAAITKAALELGYDVYRPAIEGGRYDLIFDLVPHLLRVQCKWAVYQGSTVEIPTRRCRRGREGLIHRQYQPGEIDVIAAYCAEVNTCFLLPPELSVGRAAVRLRLSACRNSQRAGIRWARDFEFGATLAKFRGPIAQLGERISGRDEVAGSSPAGSTF